MTTQPATPLSELNPTTTGYPFVERFRVQTDGTTDKDIWEIPVGTIITDIWVRIVTAGVGQTTDYIAIGDESDEDGFIAGFDPNSVAGTIIGDDPTERGDYLYDSTKKSLCGKVYTSTSTLEAVAEVATALTTNPIFDVIVAGYRVKM